MKRKTPTGMQFMIDSEFITEARKRNALSIKNTYAGEWLNEALERLEYLNKQGYNTDERK